MVWAACKPTMRGIIRSYIREQERRQWTRCEQLEAQLVELEGHAGHPDALTMQQQLVLARSELHQISLEEAKQCWQALTRRVYKLGNKAGKLLYWLATHGAVAKVVPAIRDRKGNTHVELVTIARTFVD
ncbi:hypothetical protein NDU88_002366 [Pleurodeles waltl]|uniref:Uncharacterized protein n=1 Tax=Pleurodeles waltl TaxID=8319 RepID=A0AAV7L125_PLEWA|nr:hypothetical protein NDU88_002366 [Pleurodeles waltl]